MIRIICPGCGSKLNAKDELVGQTRKCPKCALPVLIVAESAASPKDIQRDTEKGLPEIELPERLDRESHYVICDNTRVVATWENNGDGWMFKATGGFLSAKRTRENLPAQGEFQLVEFKFVMTPDGKRLSDIASYKLVSRWALTTLDQGDDAIVSKIDGLGSLNKEQKYAVRQALRDQFMRQVWENATRVMEYLGNTDYHSPGAG